MMESAKKHDLLIVSGGDMFGVAYANRQADNIIMVGEVGFTPLEALKQATSNAAIVQQCHAFTARDRILQIRDRWTLGRFRLSCSLQRAIARSRSRRRRLSP